MFQFNGRIGFSNIRDGLSNTLFIGERNSTVDYSTWVGMVHGAKHSLARIMGTTMWPPNSEPDRFETFSSKHPAGAQFVFGDGSVRMIFNGIDADLFMALGTREGQEVTCSE